MPKKQTSSPKTAVSFTDQVRLALNHVDDVAWLGEHSPLAAPYFLGSFLPVDSASAPVGRGNALVQAIRSAVTALWPEALPINRDELETAVNQERQEQGNKGSRYLFYLLELRYFRQLVRPNANPRADNDLALADHLSISRASYFNHLKAAQQALGDILLTQMQPTFRLEKPLSPPSALINRTPLLETSITTLKNGQSVSLNGAGGSGKTTIGSLIAQDWGETAVFWYTFRPDLNDRLSNLLFCLGYFLHQQGSAGLWRQLLANQGQLDNHELALAEIRGDLENLSVTPLICLDELDLIRPNRDDQTVAHRQVQAFLEGLRQLTPLLLISQQPTLHVDRHLTIPQFTETEARTFLAEQGIETTPRLVEKLYTYTAGNPRLLHLCGALLADGVTVDTIIKSLPQMSVLRALWAQLWQRFSAQERRLLQRLAVFRSPAPVDVYVNGNNPITPRLQDAVVQLDGSGAAALLPAYRDLIYVDPAYLPAELRERCHLEAAAIRSARGEFTAAAYHYYQAREEKKAIQVWFPQRQQEIRRGKAATAQALFQQLSARQLSKKEKQALSLLRGELLQLSGEPQAGLDALKQVRWTQDSELTAQAKRLQGEFLESLGYPQQALARYEDGMAVVSRLLNRLTGLHYQRSITFVAQKQFVQAWQEAQLAQYEASRLQGIVHSEKGDYETAVRYFTEALALAEQNGHDLGIAKTHQELAKTYGRQAKLDQSLRHAQTALDYYEQIGDRVNQEKMRSTLAATYFQAGKFEKSIAAAETAVSFFNEAGMPYWTAVTSATLAEAYYEAGQLDQAERTAQVVLRLEETHTQPYALYTMGLITKARQQYDDAIRYFRASQQIAQENEDRYLEAYAWRSLGEVYTLQKQETAALEAYQIALSYFSAMGLAKETAVTQQFLQ